MVGELRLEDWVGALRLEDWVGGLRLEDWVGGLGWRSVRPYLLSVVGGVGQHGGHVEHDLVVLVGGVQGVGARRVRWAGGGGEGVTGGL